MHAMAKWRAKAIELFPELRRQIAESPEIMYFWCNELRIPFEAAYDAVPRDESLIARVYAFADWCRRAPRDRDVGRDPFTAVMVAFVEHIPQHPAAREDMPRWFTPESEGSLHLLPLRV